MSEAMARVSATMLAVADEYESFQLIERDAEVSIRLLMAARQRLQCMDHFLADECPSDCIEGQLSLAIDRFLVAHELSDPPDMEQALHTAIDLATTGYAVVVGTDGSVEGTMSRDR